ncbi:MAG: L-rhamnose isomerase [Phycisphaerales bacterium]
MSTPTRFSDASAEFAAMGVDAEAALRAMSKYAVSVHCWQGDDVRGFENAGESLGGGLAVTGSYPGAARTPDELRKDAAKAMSLIPGRHRFSLHAIYAETDGKKIDRDAVAPEHFARWIAWAHELGIALDLNPTYFAHKLASSGMTLAHPDAKVRDFWIHHGKACRRIGASFGRALDSACVTNVWIPDGMKDTPADRWAPRERLVSSLDAVFAEPIDRSIHRDCVEPKLFGIGSESFVVGSHEFYLGYAAARKIMLCLDAGHYHPTEGIADKISAALPWVDGILLHVSRGVRWDSDHVVTLTDDLREIATEGVRAGERIRFGLDYFDASINRVAALAIGARALLKAILIALLSPRAKLGAAEAAGDYTERLALQEAARLLPYGVLWDEHCRRSGVPVESAWLAEVRRYERDELSRRG